VTEEDMTWGGCTAVCEVCGKHCHGVEDHEPPFHACADEHIWHVRGYENVPIPEQFDYSQFDHLLESDNE